MRKHTIDTPFRLAATISLALAAPAIAQQGSGSQQRSTAQQSGSQQERSQQHAGSRTTRESGSTNPYLRANNTWITLSGTVESVGPNSFELAYGDSGEDGRITVEMDDDDRDADGYALRNGDEVTVSGRIDDDSFASTSIEAGSVYVEKLGTYFFASSADEEDLPVVVASLEADPSATWVVGTVTGVSANEFVLDRGVRSITVEVEDMAYDPLDDEGYQRVEIGDVVSIAGNIDRDFFEGRELEARAIVTLFDHAG